MDRKTHNFWCFLSCLNLPLFSPTKLEWTRPFTDVTHYKSEDSFKSDIFPCMNEIEWESLKLFLPLGVSNHGSRRRSKELLRPVLTFILTEIIILWRVKKSCGLRAHDIKFLRYLIKDAEKYISEPINFIGGGRKWQVPRCPLRSRKFYLGVIFWQYTEGFCLDHCWWPCVEKDVR